jgi:UDP-3-O-[3-hydroxymyristoyl] glucosamine N-acyltransferase
VSDQFFCTWTNPLRIHPTAIIGEPPEMRDYRLYEEHKGVMVALSARIGAYCTIDGGYERQTLVYDDVWLMKHVHVGHDAVIGQSVEVAPHTSIGGYVVLSRGVKVGQGAVFKPYVTVGKNAQIGAGAVVTKNVPPGEVWVGNPARFLRMR